MYPAFPKLQLNGVIRDSLLRLVNTAPEPPKTLYNRSQAELLLLVNKQTFVYKTVFFLKRLFSFLFEKVWWFSEKSESFRRHTAGEMHSLTCDKNIQAQCVPLQLSFSNNIHSCLSITLNYQSCDYKEISIHIFTFKDANGCSGPSKLQ